MPHLPRATIWLKECEENIVFTVNSMMKQNIRCLCGFSMNRRLVIPLALWVGCFEPSLPPHTHKPSGNVVWLLRVPLWWKSLRKITGFINTHSPKDGSATESAAATGNSSVWKGPPDHTGVSSTSSSWSLTALRGGGSAGGVAHWWKVTSPGAGLGSQQVVPVTYPAMAAQVSSL